jgi:hypothetical protein
MVRAFSSIVGDDPRCHLDGFNSRINQIATRHRVELVQVQLADIVAQFGHDIPLLSEAKAHADRGIRRAEPAL